MVKLAVIPPIMSVASLLLPRELGEKNHLLQSSGIDYFCNVGSRTARLEDLLISSHCVCAFRMISRKRIWIIISVCRFRGSGICEIQLYVAF